MPPERHHRSAALGRRQGASIRVLVVIETLGAGGAERSLVNVLPLLQRLGHDIRVTALRPPYDLAADLEAGGLTVARIGVDPGRRPWAVLSRVADEIRAFRADVVIGHLFFGVLTVAFSRLLIPGPVTVAVFHNLGYESYPANTLKRRAAKAATSLVVRHLIDRKFAVSRAVAAHYQDHLRVSGIEVIPNAIDARPKANVSSSEIRARYRVQGDSFLIVCPGRFVHEKGHRYLIQAMKMLVQHQGLVVLLIGDGPLRNDLLRSIIDADLADKVRLVPPLPHPELMSLLQAADLIVGASTHEGQPLTPAEALLLGKPVVMTAVGGIPELIRDGLDGILVPPADPRALAEAMSRLIHDADLRLRLGTAGHQRVRDSLSPQAVAAVWDKHLMAMRVSRPRRGSR